MGSVTGSQFAGLDYKRGEARGERDKKNRVTKKPAYAIQHPRMLTYVHAPFKDSRGPKRLRGLITGHSPGPTYDSSRLLICR